jgi:hypothetical protein
MSALPSILLQKSFSTGGQKFCGPWAWFSGKVLSDPHRLTLNSSATLVARLRLHESSILARFKFSPKIQTLATFNFCNSIPSEADIRVVLTHSRSSP